MYKIQEKGKPETAIWLIKEDTILSNDGEGDFHFDATTPDPARVKIQMEEDKLYLADLTFNQPLFINHEPIPSGSKRAIKHGDSFQIANTEFEVINSKQAVSKLNSDSNANTKKSTQWKLKATDNWLAGQEFKIEGKVVLGRDNSCDITIPGSHLSRRHVELVDTGGSLAMKDLNSANGCFVNGVRTPEAHLKHNDEVRFDMLTFKVVGPSDDGKPSDLKRTIQMEALVDPDKDENSNGEKSFVSKPTSIGNRENDSLDIILAQHNRNKRMVNIIFGVIFLIVCVISFFLINI